jgi:ribosomal protein S24E
MNINIIEEKEVPIFKRKDVLLEVESPDKTPSNQELKKELASTLKTKEELIVIKGINQIFGKRTSRVKISVYKDEKTLKEIEKIKEKPKEAQPAAKPAEAPK